MAQKIPCLSKIHSRVVPVNKSFLRQWKIQGNCTRRIIIPTNPFFQISEEVRDAVNSKKPIVALETAIYTHGFPYPDNVALASHLESLIRVHGGVPATIGILQGVARVGIDNQELIELAASAGKSSTIKVSRRDLSFACASKYSGQKLNGGTTVSGTMILAHQAGIPVFATGGLGGVHRHGEDSLDISADLTELGRTKIAVVSSGCKSFLDIPRTLEFLETQGVGVCTFADGRGSNVDFPAFWSRDSGVKSPTTIQDEQQAASIAFAQLNLPVQSSILFANPVPQNQSIPKIEMDAFIEQAIRDAEQAGFTGNTNTPYVLARIRELSGNRSVPANRALIESNVIRATKLAFHLMELVRGSTQRHITSVVAADKTSLPPESSSLSPKTVENTSVKGKEKIIVAGSLAIDLSCNYMKRDDSLEGCRPQFATSNPAKMLQTIGGVGHNVAAAMSYLGRSVRLCSSVGNDRAGEIAKDSLKTRGLTTSGIRTLDLADRTAQYVAFNDANGHLILAMADMDILISTKVSFDEVWKHHIDECKPRWLVVDANWDERTLHEWISVGRKAGAKIAFEPVSVHKSKSLFNSQSQTVLGIIPQPSINIATPNDLELRSMFEAASSAGFFEREDWFHVIDALDLSNSGSRDRLISLTSTNLVDRGIPQQSIQLLPFIPNLLVTLGREGVLLTQALRSDDDRLKSPDFAPYILSRSLTNDVGIGGVYMRLFPPVETVPDKDIVSVNGVGDTFLGAIIAGLAADNPKPLSDLVKIAQKCSVLTLKSAEAVHPMIARLVNAFD